MTGEKPELNDLISSLNDEHFVVYCYDKFSLKYGQFTMGMTRQQQEAVLLNDLDELGPSTSTESDQYSPDSLAEIAGEVNIDLAASVLRVINNNALKQGDKPFSILVSRLIDKISEHFAQRAGAKAQKSWANYLDDPEDYAEVFKKYLKGELESNHRFHQEISALLAQIQVSASEAGINIIVSGSGSVATEGGVSAGKGGVAIGGNVKGGIHIGKSR